MAAPEPEPRRSRVQHRFWLPVHSLVRYALRFFPKQPFGLRVLYIFSLRTGKCLARSEIPEVARVSRPPESRPPESRPPELRVCAWPGPKSVARGSRPPESRPPECRPPELRVCAWPDPKSVARGSRPPEGRPPESRSGCHLFHSLALELALSFALKFSRQPTSY